MRSKNVTWDRALDGIAQARRREIAEGGTRFVARPLDLREP